MSTADEQTRVSSVVKTELENRRRVGESFNDVLERLLTENRDLFAGFGAFEGTDRGESVQEVHDRGKRDGNDRMRPSSQ